MSNVGQGHVPVLSSRAGGLICVIKSRHPAEQVNVVSGPYAGSSGVIRVLLCPQPGMQDFWGYALEDLDPQASTAGRRRTYHGTPSRQPPPPGLNTAKCQGYVSRAPDEANRCLIAVPARQVFLPKV